MTFVPYLVDAHLHTFFRVLRPGGLDLLMSERVGVIFFLKKVS